MIMFFNDKKSQNVMPVAQFKEGVYSFPILDGGMSFFFSFEKKTFSKINYIYYKCLEYNGFFNNFSKDLYGRIHYYKASH